MENNKIQGYGYTSDEIPRSIKKEDTIFTIKIVAQIINKKGFGRNKIYELLRKLGYIEENNYAKEKYLEEGYFINFETRRDFGGIHGDTNQLLVTIKGLNLIKDLVKNYIK